MLTDGCATIDHVPDDALRLPWLLPLRDLSETNKLLGAGALRAVRVDYEGKTYYCVVKPEGAVGTGHVKLVGLCVQSSPMVFGFLSHFIRKWMKEVGMWGVFYAHVPYDAVAFQMFLFSCFVPTRAVLEILDTDDPGTVNAVPYVRFEYSDEMERKGPIERIEEGVGQSLPEMRPQDEPVAPPGFGEESN